MYSLSILIFALLSLFQAGQSWKYCPDFDQDSDDFGVQHFEATPWNHDEVYIHLKGKLKTNIYAAFKADTDVKPKLRIKIFKKSNGKEIYSDTKNLCDYTSCPLLDGDEATIKVHTVSGFDKKLKDGEYYVAEMAVIKRCGREVTCVKDLFCYLGKNDKKKSKNLK